MTEAIPTTVSRPLSCTELLLHYAHEQAGILIDSNIAIFGGKKLSQQVVETALTELQRREPILRCRISPGENSVVEFTPMPEPKINLIIKPAGSGENWWSDELHNDLEVKFDALNGPLWRATLFQDESNQNDPTTVMLFSFHHSAFDGGSIMAFYEKFLTLCAEVDQNTVDFNVQPIEGIPVEIEKLYKQPVKWFRSIPFLIRVMWSFYRAITIFTPEKFQSPILLDDSVKPSTHVLPLRLSGETLKSIQTSCKARNLSVHSALTAAAFLGYQKFYDIPFKPGQTTITCHSVSSRAYCTPRIPNSVLGCFIAPFVALVKFPRAKTDEEKFWEYAGSVQSSIHTKYLPNYIAFLQWIWKKLLKAPKPSTEVPKPVRHQSVPFNISNRGYFRAFDKPFGEYKLIGTYWATAEQLSGFPHTHNIATFGNEIHWSLTYYPQFTTYEQTLGYAQTILQILNETCIKE